MIFQSHTSMLLSHTGCPKSKVTILIFNNFSMKKVAWMKFSWYLVMIQNFCLKLINLYKFTYLANADYSGTTGDFQDNIATQELITFSNKRMFLCFPVLTRTWKLLIIFCFVYLWAYPFAQTHIFCLLIWPDCWKWHSSLNKVFKNQSAFSSNFYDAKITEL